MTAEPIIDWGLILTQEGYPFHELPESWAVASALSLTVATDLMDNDNFTIAYRNYYATTSRLLGWLIENPRRHDASS